MSVCCECCVLSGRGLCDGLITCPEESYRLWCVVVCDLEKSQEWGGYSPWLGCKRQRKKKKWWLYVQLLPTWKLFWLKPHQFVCVIILLFTMTCPKANYPFSRPYFSSLQGTKREIRRADLQSLYGLGI
jgi:hypothetical protein